MAVTDLDGKAMIRSSRCKVAEEVELEAAPMKSNTALSQFVYAALYFRCVGSLFDSLVIGDVMVHNKFTGIHIMDFHPLAGLASTSSIRDHF